MKLKNQIIFSLLGMLLIACSDVDEYLTKDEKIQKKLTIQAANKLQKEKGLVFIGWGGNGPDNKWDLMILSLNYDEPLDIRKGRELLLYAIKTYLNEINSNEKIRPYLIHYPFTEKDIEIIIIIQNPKDPPESLEVVKCVRGKILYKGEKDKLFEYQLKETYEQALKELEKEKNNPTPHGET